MLVGNHSTLCRWLMPDWDSDKAPGPREVARAAAVHGVPYTLVTGFVAADQYLETHLASPETVMATARYERFDATFNGAGDTLSAALTALIAGAGFLAVVGNQPQAGLLDNLFVPLPPSAPVKNAPHKPMSLNWNKAWK